MATFTAPGDGAPPDLAPSTPDSSLDASHDTPPFDNRHCSRKRADASDLWTVRRSFGHDGDCIRVEEAACPAAEPGSAAVEDVATGCDRSSSSSATVEEDATLATGESTTLLNYDPRCASGETGEPATASECSSLGSWAESSASLLSWLVAPLGEVFSASSSGPGGICGGAFGEGAAEGIEGGPCGPPPACAGTFPSGYGEGKDGDGNGNGGREGGCCVEVADLECPSDGGPLCADAVESELAMPPGPLGSEVDGARPTLGIVGFRSEELGREREPRPRLDRPGSRPARTDVFRLAVGSGLFVDLDSMDAYSDSNIIEDCDEEARADGGIPAFGTQLTRIDECESDECSSSSGSGTEDDECEPGGEREAEAVPSPTSVSADLSPTNGLNGGDVALSTPPPPMPDGTARGGVCARSRKLAKAQRRFARPAPGSGADAGGRTETEAGSNEGERSASGRERGAASEGPSAHGAETESCPTAPASPPSVGIPRSTSSESTTSSQTTSPQTPSPQHEKLTIDTSFDESIEERRADELRRAREAQRRLKRAWAKRKDRRREVMRTVLLTGSLL